MKTIPINNKVIGVVEVPEDIRPNIELIKGIVHWYSPTKGNNFQILPKGNWQILGRASEITEEQAREIVEKTTMETAYVDYDNDFFICKTALESFQSFCKANQIKETDLILIQG